MGKETKPQFSLKKVKQYLIVGRAKPTEKEPEPKVYRMRVFAPNTVVAKSRFWTLMRKQKKIKHTGAELIALHEVPPFLHLLDARVREQVCEGLRNGGEVPVSHELPQHVQGVPRHQPLRRSQPDV